MKAPRSSTHVIVVPSYNPGSVVLEVVSGLVTHGLPVWVMIDGSDDGSPEALEELKETLPLLRLFRFPENRGKGAVMLEAARQAHDDGFTHLLSFDSDGQHPVDHVPKFLEASQETPNALILGRPQFGKEAPIERIWWRKAANFWTAVITVGGGIHDVLFGMRVYPVEALKNALESTSWARRFDFEPEVAIRLSWAGTPAINLPTPVRYLKRDEGGVSHFRYGRDNVLLGAMFIRLLLGMFLRLPALVALRMRR